MDDKDKKIEELEFRLQAEIDSKDFWIREANRNSQRAEKLRALLKQVIDELWESNLGY